MTVPYSNSNPVQYAGNGTAVTFSFPFEIFAATDLFVGFIVNGSYTLQTSGYTFGGGSIGNSGGGFVAFAVPPPIGTTVDLRTEVPPTQLTNFANLSSYLPENTTNAMDRVTRVVQDLTRRTYTFGMHGPDTESVPWPALPPPLQRLGMQLICDPITGIPTVGVPNSQVITTALLASFLELQQTAAEAALGVTPANLAYARYTILRYYSGSGDYTSAIQTACNCAAQANHSMVRTGLPGLYMGVAGAWTIDTNRTGIDFEGAILDAAGFTTGNWCSPTQSNPDTNLRPMLNAAHPIQNATFLGAGAQFNTNVSVYENDTTLSPANCAGIIFRNIGFSDWGTAVNFGAGAFMETFDTCFISTSSRSTGVSANYSVIQSGALNSGERNTFINCTISNNGWGIQNVNGNGVIDLINCSIDYIENKALYCSGGQINMIGGHIESSYDLDYWVYCTGANSSILLSGLDISVAANKPNFSICYSDSTVVAGGIKLQDVYLKSSFNFSNNPLCAGTGIFAIRGLQEFQTGQRLPIGAYANQFAYGTFESANWAGDWTLGGSTPPSRSTAQNHTPGGTESLAFAGTSSNTPTASRTFPAKPGAIAHGEVWNIAPSFANGTFFGSWAWVDAAGNSLSNGQLFSVTSALAAWTLTQFNTTVAPPGTAGFALFFDVFGATSGTQTGYIDDLQCAVIEP